MTKTLRIGLLGCGVVGGSVVELLGERREAIQSAAGVDFVVSRVAVRDATKERPGVSLDLLTADAEAVVFADDIDIVIEVVGGIEPARTLILAALANGKPVITANKELLAHHGAELYAAADAAGVDLLFEAAVAGAIPIVRPIRQSLLGEDVTRIVGIINGTTNYILTSMSSDGTSYADALAEAQELGYAEADPTADVEGLDAGAKAAIMASLAFDADVIAADVYHEGISKVTASDIASAQRLGYEIKLLAIAEVFEGSGREVGVRVHPTMVPRNHPLASIRGAFNAIFVEGRSAGDLMFYGRGAGGRPTASAVVGDLVDAGINLVKGSHMKVPGGGAAQIRAMDDLESAFYLSLDVLDAPGVLAEVAGVLAKYDLSVSSMDQTGTGDGATISIITHLARERDFREARSELLSVESVRGIGSVLRVLEEAS